MYTEFIDCYERLCNQLATGKFEHEIKKARIEFNTLIELPEDEGIAEEMRLNLFLDWYLFDRPHSETGKIPLEIFLDQNITGLTEDERELYEGFRKSVHSIFEIKKLGKDFLKLKDLFKLGTYIVFERRSLAGFAKGDIFEGRLFPMKGTYIFSRAFCFHPKNAKNFISKSLKKALKEGKDDIKDLIFKFQNMSLRLKIYRYIKVEDIYK